MSIKNWKTDIRIKLPRLHIIRPNHYHVVSEELVKSYLKLSVPVSFVGWWAIIKFALQWIDK